jgi:hypothetical protein
VGPLNLSVFRVERNPLFGGVPPTDGVEIQNIDVRVNVDSVSSDYLVVVIS